MYFATRINAGSPIHSSNLLSLWIKTSKEGKEGTVHAGHCGGKKMSERENLYTNRNNSLSDSWLDV